MFVIYYIITIFNEHITTMNLPINQIKTVEEKLRLYNKPFIEQSFLQKILDKFAPNYKPFQLSAKGLISVIKNGELYKNELYSGDISRYAILSLYMKESVYMLGGAFVYNQYGFSTQIATRYTVYNTIYSWQREIAWAKFIFRRVRPSFFRGKQRKQSQNIFYYVMTPERALTQLLIDTNGNPEFDDDIRMQIKKWRVSISIFQAMSKKYCLKSQQIFIQNFLNKWKK